MLSLCCAETLASTTVQQEPLLPRSWPTAARRPSQAAQLGKDSWRGHPQEISQGAYRPHPRATRCCEAQAWGPPRVLPNVPKEKCCFGIASDRTSPPPAHLPPKPEHGNRNRSSGNICSPSLFSKKLFSFWKDQESWGRGAGKRKEPSHAGLARSGLPGRLTRHWKFSVLRMARDWTFYR